MSGHSCSLVHCWSGFENTALLLPILPARTPNTAYAEDQISLMLDLVSFIFAHLKEPVIVYSPLEKPGNRAYLRHRDHCDFCLVQ